MKDIANVPSQRVPVAQLDRAPASGAGCRWFESTQARHLFYLFLLAFSIRLFYFYQVGQSPFLFPPLGLDPSLYHHWAQSIAAGKGMGKEVFQAMPLYPYFLGFLYKVTVPGLFWAKLIQLLMGAVTVLLVYQIGKALFDPFVGWLAALCQAFSAVSIFYEELLVPTALVTFLLAVTCFCLLRAAENNALRDWVKAGICLGVTLLAHAGVLIFLPFFFFWVMRVLPSPFLKKCLAAGVVIVSVLFALLAVLLRNLLVAHDPVLLTAHGGVNFYIGNHSGASGRFESLFSRHTSSEQLLQESKRAAEKETGRTMKAGEVSRFWFRKGFEFIRESPAQYADLLFRKLLLFWNSYEIPDVEDYYFFRSRFSALRGLIPLGWMMPFALLGITVSFREFRRLSLLYGFFLSQMAAILTVFVNSRYRAPLAFFIFLFAAAGVRWFCRLFAAKRYRALVLVSFLLLHLVFLTRLSVGALDEELQHYNTGIVLDSAGEHDAAIREFKKALVMSPYDGTLLFALANAHFRKGDFEEARQRYEEAIRYIPDHADAYYNLGLLYFRGGRLEKAEDAFQKSVSLKSDQPDVYYLLNLLYRKEGLLSKAEEAKARALALGADPAALEKEPEGLFVR